MTTQAAPLTPRYEPDEHPPPLVVAGLVLQSVIQALPPSSCCP